MTAMVCSKCRDNCGYKLILKYSFRRCSECGILRAGAHHDIRVWRLAGNEVDLGRCVNIFSGGINRLDNSHLVEASRDQPIVRR